MRISAGIVAILGTVSLVVVIIFSMVFWYDFSKNCEGYLKLAGDAPNVEKADQFLGQALNYIERRNLTKGNSAYIFSTPQNDVGIWFEQIKGAKEITSSILEKSKKNTASVSQLERDNALMKIREVVLDNSRSGTSVTTPENITWFPYQWIMMVWWIVTGVTVIAGCIMVKASKYW